MRRVTQDVQRRQATRGFSLFELLVVLAIFIIITTVTIASDSRFGGKVALEALAYDIALSIREAQIYGVAVQRFGTDDYTRGYGIRFSSQVGSNTSYHLFGDAVLPPANVIGNGLYDTGELVKTTTIQGGYTISSICARPVGGSETCGFQTLDVTFRRPEPDAYIRANGANTLYEGARVIVRAPQGDTTPIVIEVSGQISVQ